MSHHPFRNMTPQRTCTKKRTDYHAYKAFLAEDFNHRCGYTDCSDHWFGGKRNFQIDHLKPKSIYPELVNEYGNLVYCCSYVNNAKSDDDNPNYLDPCNVDFNLHFERDDMGFIKAITHPKGSIWLSIWIFACPDMLFVGNLIGWKKGLKYSMRKLTRTMLQLKKKICF